MVGFHPIDTAPVNEDVRIRAGGMTFPARLVPDVSLNEMGQPCDQWQATHEGNHPPCWSDGCCWQSNEDEVASLQPSGWQPIGATA